MKKLTVTTSLYWVLKIQCFDSAHFGSGNIKSTIIPTSETPDDIYKRILDFDKKEKEKYSDPTMFSGRDVVYCYWVKEYEKMIDDRSKFGHNNQESSKEIKEIVPRTYVRGKILTLREALSMAADNKFSHDTKCNLSYFISTQMDFDENNLQENQLDKKILMIPGERKRQTFFEHYSGVDQMRIFLENELMEIKEETEIVV